MVATGVVQSTPLICANGLVRPPWAIVNDEDDEAEVPVSEAEITKNTLHDTLRYEGSMI